MGEEGSRCDVCGCGRMSWERCVESGRCVCTWEDELGEQMCGEWEACVYMGG